MEQRKEQEKTKWKWQGKRMISFLLSLAMVLTLMPIMSVKEARADSFNYASLIPDSQAGDDLTALQVTFNSKKWYVVGYGNTGVTTPDGYVTLLAADDSFGVSQFNESPTNTYSGSTVGKKLAALTAQGGEFAEYAEAIKSRSDVTNDTDTPAKLYLLDIDEAEKVAANVRKSSFSGDMNAWWLRSPGYNARRAAFVDGDGGGVDAYGDHV